MIVPKELKYFRSLYSDYYDEMFTTATTILYDYDEARSVVRDVFCNLWDDACEIEIEGDDILKYLLKSVISGSFDRIRYLNITGIFPEMTNECVMDQKSIGQNEKSSFDESYPLDLFVISCHRLI